MFGTLSKLNANQSFIYWGFIESLCRHQTLAHWVLALCTRLWVYPLEWSLWQTIMECKSPFKSHFMKTRNAGPLSMRITESLVIMIPVQRMVERINFCNRISVPSTGCPRMFYTVFQKNIKNIKSTTSLIITLVIECLWYVLFLLWKFHLHIFIHCDATWYLWKLTNNQHAISAQKVNSLKHYTNKQGHWIRHFLKKKAH